MTTARATWCMRGSTPYSTGAFCRKTKGIDGHKGRSFTVSDASRNIWHQTWVTSRGELLEIEGKMENGEMVLSGENQEGALVRGRGKPEKGGVREIAAKSRDGGKSWEPWFDVSWSGGKEVTDVTPMAKGQA